MKGCVWIHYEIAGEQLLNTLPCQSQITVNLSWLILGELIGQIQAIKAVGLNQVIGRSDETNLTNLLALQQIDILVGMIRVDVMIAAHTQQNFQVGILPLEGGNLGELMLVYVQILVHTVRL